MGSYNKVIVIGNLTRDVELRQLSNGCVANLSLATNRRWTKDGQKQEEVTYVEVTLWGKQAELANQYLSKGSNLLIEGRLSMDTWDDKETGKKRSKLFVTGEKMQFMGKREEGNQAPPQAPQGYQNDGMAQDYQVPPHPQSQAPVQPPQGFVTQPPPTSAPLPNGGVPLTPQQQADNIPF